MKDLFAIQTESGQLWPDIKEQIDLRDAQIYQLSLERKNMQSKLDAISVAHSAGDMNMIAEELQSENDRKREELDSKIEAMQKERDALK